MEAKRASAEPPFLCQDIVDFGCQNNLIVKIRAGWYTFDAR